MSNIWFFFSYAPADYGAYLRKFYEDLTSELRGLLALPRAKLGFFDRDTIALSATWDAALEEALRSCRVFLPLYSPSYFRSPYCGKEFALFQKRLHNYQQQQGLPVDYSLILPVLWLPERVILRDLPAPINKIPYTDESYPNEYTSEGVRSLLRLRKYHDQYQIFVTKLAVNIVKAAQRVVLPPFTTPLPPLDMVMSLFSTTTQRLPSSSDESEHRFVESLGDLAPPKSDTSSKVDDSKVLANSATSSKLTETSDVTEQNQLIFISYRREDTADISGRIYDRLVQRFGPKAIFKDVDSIPLGVDFKQYLEKQVEQCNVLLAVIGKSWLRKRTGKRRLDDPRDFVRIEIASALRRGIRVIPLMVSKALMPPEADLPEDLRALVFRNFIQIRPDPDFHHDMNRLIKELESATLIDKD